MVPGLEVQLSRLPVSLSFLFLFRTIVGLLLQTFFLSSPCPRVPINIALPSREYCSQRYSCLFLCPRKVAQDNGLFPSGLLPVLAGSYTIPRGICYFIGVSGAHRSRSTSGGANCATSRSLYPPYFFSCGHDILRIEWQIEIFAGSTKTKQIVILLLDVCAWGVKAVKWKVQI